MTSISFAIVLMSAMSVYASVDQCASIENSTSQFEETTNEFKGCRLNSVEPHSMYGKLGFKEGDIVQPMEPQSKKDKKMKLEVSSKSSKTRPLSNSDEQ